MPDIHTVWYSTFLQCTSCIILSNNKKDFLRKILCPTNCSDNSFMSDQNEVKSDQNCKLVRHTVCPVKKKYLFAALCWCWTRFYFFKFKKNIHNSRSYMHALCRVCVFFFIIITWLNVGLLCIREHRSPWRHAPILK